MGNSYQTVAFQTLGCKLNYAETSTIERSFIKSGYSIVDFDDPADVYVINSCSVTENADKKARKIIRKALSNSPFAKIIVTGCYAQLNPTEISNISGVSLVVGTEDKFNLPENLESMHSSDNFKIITSNIKNVNSFEPSFSIGKRTRTYLKIQDGCDYNCSFCTIPMARGKSRSSSIDEVMCQVEEIISLGVLEIVLTGINIGDFGVRPDEDLLKLMLKLDKINGKQRYRVSSIEPNLLSDEIIQFIAESDKFLPHFHVPLQSGSDIILKSMQRRYDKDLFSNRMNNIKKMMPNACIGVDVIVGFPGEDEDCFQETYDFINNLDISYLHVFSYSERNDTKSVTLQHKVETDKIIDRSKALHILSKEKKDKFYAKNHGSIRNVLIENYNDGFLSGFSENYIKVKTKGQVESVNTIIPLELNYSSDGIMLGKRI